MKFSHGQNGADAELDDIDRHILALLQEDCRTALARIGEQVGLSAPAVLERIKKLEQAHVIAGYHAALDARALGLDVTAFIGVITDAPDSIGRFEEHILELPDVLECHHVTGEYTLLLKAKTSSTSSLEKLISRIRALDGVARTETTVVLSTLAERSTLALEHPGAPRPAPQSRRNRRVGHASEAQVRRA